jgi:AraC-like DNA-binding protein
VTVPLTDDDARPGFDRWVIDAETSGASQQMQTVMSKTLLPYIVDTDTQPVERTHRSPCIVRRAQFGGLSLLDCDVPSAFSGHTRPIGDDDPERFVITLLTAGEEVVHQDGRHATLTPGDIFIVDAALPGTCHIPDRIHTVTLVVPKSLFSMSGALPEKLPAQSPMARLLGDYMRSLVRDVATLPTRAVSVATRATLELIQLVTAADSQPLESVPIRVALLPGVLRYIERMLHDEDLAPRKIAEANVISVRTLHAMFADTGESVSDYIRRLRLERSRETLISAPRAAVIDVARHWGFKNASHFARVFKDEYGVAPQTFRRFIGDHAGHSSTTAYAVSQVQ